MKKIIFWLVCFLVFVSLQANAGPWGVGVGSGGGGSVSSYSVITALFGSGSCTGADALMGDGSCTSNIATATNLADYANLWTGAMTDGHLIVYDSASKKGKDGGAPTTINAGNSTLLCKDSSGEVEACGGVTISGTTSPVVNINPAEVDGHTTSTDLTAAQVSNTVIHNYDQAASDVFLIAPAAAAGYSALFNVVTAQSNHWCFEAAANDKIYLIAADGTVAAGDDGAAVCMIAAQVGQSFACWTFKSGASTYDWMCKAISIGTSTFEAHASSE